MWKCSRDRIYVIPVLKLRNTIETYVVMMWKVLPECFLKANYCSAKWGCCSSNLSPSCKICNVPKTLNAVVVIWGIRWHSKKYCNRTSQSTAHKNDHPDESVLCTYTFGNNETSLVRVLYKQLIHCKHTLLNNLLTICFHLLLCGSIDLLSELILLCNNEYVNQLYK